VEHTTVRNEDAQRELERRALRNVRALVDNLERRERIDARRGMRLVAGVLVGVMLAIGAAFAIVHWTHRPSGSTEIQLAPVRVPPAR
jgi:hypothetical protein